MKYRGLSSIRWMYMKKELKRKKMEKEKDLEYWRNNAEEDYITTPISVLRYITELENEIKQNKDE